MTLFAHLEDGLHALPDALLFMFLGRVIFKAAIQPVPFTDHHISVGLPHLLSLVYLGVPYETYFSGNFIHFLAARPVALAVPIYRTTLKTCPSVVRAGADECARR